MKSIFKPHFLFIAQYYFSFSLFSSCFLEKKHGCIHNLSPIKTAKKTKHQWYNFQFQTAPSKVRRVVGFNTSIHPCIQLYQDSKTPVLLKDVIIKEDESDWLFNQQSTAYPCANSDISFQYEEQAKPETNYQPIRSTDATTGQVPTIKPNQRVNVSGTLSLRDKKPKEVMIKSTQKSSYVKEDCILEDDTGAIVFHIWSTLIDQVQTNKSCKFTNLTVKYYQRSTSSVHHH